MVGIDARDGHVAVEGWAETSKVKALDLARRVRGLRASPAIIYTDIDRDGAMMGVNVEATTALAWALTDAGDRLGRRLRRSPTSRR